MLGFASALGTDHAKLAYERTAPFYDRLTAHHDYERWLPRLVAMARRSGLKGTRLLDVACGTGKSFLPLLRAGWEVTACDISPAMLRRARSKAEGQARLELADMRRLPVLGKFDLVWVIDDAVNYLRSIDELEACLAGLARNLAPGGRVMFDTNTLRTYDTFFSEREVLAGGGGRLSWEGHGNGRVAAGSTVEATFHAESLAGASNQISAIHRQRHFRPSQVCAAMAAAGLECLAVMGQGPDGHPQVPLDERRHTKAIFVGQQSERR
jgi:SAM-dependent methyltransferase